MGEGHLPVLVDEVLASLDPRTGSSIADCTVGGGGHAERLLEASSPDGRLLGLDADRAAIAEAQRTLARFGSRVVLRQANFAAVYEVAREEELIPLDGVLFDLGLSSYQLADASRGFSFAADAPPDMRFDEDAGLSALELIDRTSERELAGILATFGEERRPGRIAKAILAARAEGRLVTAADLAAVVAAASPARGADAGRIHPATRTFQALRIAVNRELEVLGAGLAGGLAALRPGGRMAVISYHSGEDRIVKRFMARESRDCVEDPMPPVCTCGHRAQLRILHRRGITPGADEISRNRRARSARLRVAEKLQQGGIQP
ncbi:MAG TPA: 16S rRNA (cytosine(1402)-N(4))-methyltransferase RsmH [Candidatus Limnocylindria bacterium]|jgi:16S rRNA (cytosine1402-N4)-methyltransferase|nr:16S rRNA (cytosine(1402)-N(4))-methyltransferase RsmH [Candidatus Limnocylindria bacterium]